ncbi:MAG TPA: TolC family protein [Fimbriimonadaceae bacterium]|nr:TolC family protein [Fimbriimonadaceae bacterium]
MFVAQAGPQTLTLEDALNLADRNAFAILIQQAAVEKQRQAVNQTNGTLGPTFSVGSVYTRNDSQATVNFNGNTVIVSPLQTATATATVTLPIDISGNMHRLLRASKASLLAQRETLEASRNDTRRSVKTAYLAVLRAESQAKVAQEAIANETERVRTTQAQFEHGTAAKIDVLTAQTQLSQSKSDLITAQNAISVNKAALNSALARPIKTPVDVVDQELSTPPNGDEDALDGIAQNQRPEALALLKTREALAQIRRATEQGLMPTLGLGVTYQRNIDAQGFGARSGVGVGTLTLNWPLYDSGQTRAKVKEARQDEETARLQYEQLLNGISLDVRQSFANLMNAKAKLDLATDQVASAKEALRLAKLKLDQGEGIYLEVLNAQTSLTQAEQGQVSARYDYLQALADLQHAVGSDTFGGGSK